MIGDDTLCPCMNALSYKQCCKPFHVNASKPNTAEQLMRSRYSAYYLGLIDYLVMTTHPDTLRSDYRNQLQNTKNDTQWIGLEIIQSSMGRANDKIGKVRFKAQYIENGQEKHMEEHSRFRRYQGNWVYYDDKG